MDFQKRKNEAEAKAKPYWLNAVALNEKAAGIERNAQGIKRKLVPESDRTYRKNLLKHAEEMLAEAQQIRQQSREQQSIGDRHFWPIYNLDLKNPNAPEEETQDADKLLQKYRAVCQSIAETESKLKAELSAALAHHFTTAESAS